MTHDHAHHGSHAHGGHDHASHGHHHGVPARRDAAFGIGVALNATLVAAQIAVGLIAGSTALLADAVHNLGDVLGLLLAWGAIVLGRRGPSPGRTYGWGRTTILASLANAVLLLVSIGAIGLEAVQRLLSPVPVQASLVAVVAAGGLLVNGGTALLFMRGRQNDLNIRSAFTHMAADAALSAGVLGAALVIMQTGATWLDPLASLAIIAVIGVGTWSLLKESANLAMDAVPPGLNQTQIGEYLAGLPGVAEVHDLHVWALSTTESALTVHLVQCEPADGPALVPMAVAGLKHRFGIGHATVQIETAACAAGCAQRPGDVV
jgi:cobalt-zinc-cadmium efflux system protein